MSLHPTPPQALTLQYPIKTHLSLFPSNQLITSHLNLSSKSNHVNKTHFTHSIASNPLKTQNKSTLNAFKTIITLPYCDFFPRPFLKRALTLSKFNTTVSFASLEIGEPDLKSSLVGATSYSLIHRHLKKDFPIWQNMHYSMTKIFWRNCVIESSEEKSMTGDEIFDQLSE